MGKVAEMKKKKKGRPSLLDLQKRSLRLQQEHQEEEHSPITNPYSNPNFKNPKTPNPYSDPNSRSTRRKASELIDGDGDDDDERKEKKLKLVVRLPSNNDQPRSSVNSLSLNSVSYASDSNANGDIHEGSHKKRKINAVGDGSGDFAAQKGEKVSKATDTTTLHGSPLESGPTTPLPDKKLLVFILDRLQKKDTYDVFSEPVDPNELPDYHEIVEHPMDFGTVRKGLDGGLYSTLEQFETDVFLICSNAMQYNSPDTIYFRQARSIQELAKKDFENLRQESDDSEPQPKVVRRGRPPSKNLKKSLGNSPFECVGPEFSLDATLGTGGDNAMWSNSYNLRKGPISYRFRPADASVRASHRSRNSETYGWLSEKNNEFPVSVLTGLSMKYGKKQVVFDENRRDTYKQSYPSVSSHEPCVLTTLDGDIKQLMAVGLNLEHGYARSLARFAANLGPVVWKIASKKIESVLPSGLKFGPGWVGENEASPQQPSPLSEKLKFSNNLVPDNHLVSSLPTSTSGSLNSVVADRSLPSKEEMVEAVGGLNSQSQLALLKSSVGGIRPGLPPQIQQKHVIPPDMNGFSGAFGLKLSSQMGMVRRATPTGKFGSEEASIPSQMLGMVSRSNTTSILSMPANQFNLEEPMLEISSRIHSGNSLAPDSVSRSHTAPNMGLFGKPSGQGLSLHHRQDSLPVPPDLNVRFHSPGSPISSVRIGSPQQPDLALQL